jgi:hypothetical protein
LRCIAKSQPSALILFLCNFEKGIIQNGGFFCNQTKQQAHQINLKPMTCVTHSVKRIVKLANVLCLFDIDWVLRFDDLCLIVRNKAERLYILV